MRRIYFVLLLCLVIALILNGCGILQKLGIGNSNNDEIFPVSSIFISEVEAGKLTDKIPVFLYFANEDNTKLKKVVRYIPIAEAKKSTETLASAIVKELIKGPGNVEGVQATIPEGTELRAPVVIENGVATVDLSKHFVENHPGGKEVEQMTIYSVVNTLTEMIEIQKVQFKVGGKERKEFKGSFQLDEAFPRTPSLISDEPPIQETMTEDTVDVSKPEESDSKEESDKEEKDSKDNSRDTYFEILE